MNHGSLFSGIGGFDLAAQWIGWKNIFQVEIDEFCQKVLEKNFPDVQRYGDIRKFDGTQYRGTVDIISGGFPCQPFSVAGDKRGTSDDRYLWPEMFRVIEEIEPSFVVCENVPGIIRLALDEVLSDLENGGYSTETFVIPACAVNAPHRRDRVWIIAYACCCRQQGGKQRVCQTFEKGFIKENLHSGELWAGRFGDHLSTPGICRATDGLPDRVDRIKALGNAIVPQLAYEIFKAINKVQSKKH